MRFIITDNSHGTTYALDEAKTEPPHPTEVLFDPDVALIDRIKALLYIEGGKTSLQIYNKFVTLKKREGAEFEIPKHEEITRVCMISKELKKDYMQGTTIYRL